MRTLIPFDASDPKRRLSPVMDAAERSAFAEAMLADVLDAMAETALSPRVVSTEPLDGEVSVPVRIDDRPLDPLVQAAIDDETPVAVVMADLPLLDRAALERMLGTGGDVVLAPGRGAGTNAMVVRDDAFTVDYHGTSIRDHRRIARERGLTVGTVDSFRLATDVDEPGDLLEVLVHGHGRAAAWLRSAGFRVRTDDEDRPVVGRD